MDRMGRKWSISLPVQNLLQTLLVKLTETSNCTSSAQTTFARSCVGCDGDGFQPKCCNETLPNKLNVNRFEVHGASWAICHVIACNSTGERLRS